MSRKNRHKYRPQPERKPAPDYELQATPLILRDLGWEFVKELGESVYPKFEQKDFRKLLFTRDGRTLVDGLDVDVPIKVFFASLKEFTDSPSDRVLMITPYIDQQGIKVLYFKWADETLYDSFAVPDGQNRTWENREKQ